MFKALGRYKIVAVMTALALFAGLAISALPKRAVYAALSTDAVNIVMDMRTPSGLSPTGAVYTAYKRNNNGILSDECGTFTIGANGKSDKLAFTAASMGAEKIYIKQTSLPTATNPGYAWVLDDKIYEAKLQRELTITGTQPAAQGDGWVALANSDVYSDTPTSFSFSLAENVSVDIWVVGGGEDGGNAVGSMSHTISGKGGDGGYVLKIENIAVPAGTVFDATVAARNDPTGSVLKIGNRTYRCDDPGSFHVEGGASGEHWGSDDGIIIPKSGKDGIHTPYGWLGSSGGAGTACPSTGRNDSNVGGQGAGGGNAHGVPGTDASYYSCGGGGGSSCGSTMCNGGRGGSGAIVIAFSQDSTMTVTTDVAEVRTNYNYVQVSKSVGSTTGQPLSTTYSPAGAVYGVYNDAACTDKIDEVTIGANGRSNKLRVGWDPTQTGKTVWVKEISAPPVPANAAHTWTKDTTVYRLDLSCTTYIPNDANVPVKVASSTDNVTESMHVKVHKTVPSGRNPQGAVYKAYTSNNNGTLSGECGTFTIGANGDSNVLKFNMPGLGVTRIYIKEVSAPNADTSADFTWLLDGTIYTVQFDPSCTASAPFVVGSKDSLRTLYGYVQVSKSVAGANGSALSGTYSPAGAVYSVYSDSACRNKLTDLIIGAGNVSGKYKVSWPASQTGKTVYIKETGLPTNSSSSYEWSLDPTVYTARVECDSYVASDADAPVYVVNSSDAIQEYAYCAIRKVTDFSPCYRDIAKGNACYSLAGAEFKIETAYPTRQVVGTYKTNAQGLTETIRLKPGSYYITETKAPKGYMLPAEPTQLINIYQDSTSNEPYIATFEDVPVSDPTQIAIDKDWAT